MASDGCFYIAVSANVIARGDTGEVNNVICRKINGSSATNTVFFGQWHYRNTPLLLFSVFSFVIRFLENPHSWRCARPTFYAVSLYIRFTPLDATLHSNPNEVVFK